MKFHVGGTLVAAALAMQYGWAINIGGEAYCNGPASAENLSARSLMSSGQVQH